MQRRKDNALALRDIKTADQNNSKQSTLNAKDVRQLISYLLGAQIFWI